MRAVLAAALIAVAAPAIAASNAGSERFAAVTIVAGEGVAVNLGNAPSPIPVDPPITPCPLAISFFAANGSQIGTTQNVTLNPGVSMSVPASSPQPGLVRAVISISDSSRDFYCGVKADLDVFDTATGATRFLLPSDICIGPSQCSAPLLGK